MKPKRFIYGLGPGLKAKFDDPSKMILSFEIGVEAVYSQRFPLVKEWGVDFEERFEAKVGIEGTLFDGLATGEANFFSFSGSEDWLGRRRSSIEMFKFGGSIGVPHLPDQGSGSLGADKRGEISFTLLFLKLGIEFEPKD